VEIEQKEISSALVKVLDVRNHPGNFCIFIYLILDKLILKIKFIFSFSVNSL